MQSEWIWMIPCLSTLLVSRQDMVAFRCATFVQYGNPRSSLEAFREFLIQNSANARWAFLKDHLAIIGNLSYNMETISYVLRHRFRPSPYMWQNKLAECRKCYIQTSREKSKMYMFPIQWNENKEEKWYDIMGLKQMMSVLKRLIYKQH